ncbi:uncharacterized protein [Antennarius striatus]|uniref:uncharacterized protein isoform X2 n=1 Tax=Antennarius striatus TaxID=241820 RepID=UPI0035B09F89
MDEIADTQRPMFSRLQPLSLEHLKPLSLYSRLITSDPEASLDYLCNPIHFTIEMRNNCMKSNIHDSGIDEHYETPLKKADCRKSVSPDAGCFLDCSSPTAGQYSSSKIGITQNVSPQVSSEPQSPLYKPHSVMCKNDLSEVALAFDDDVDNIFSLNPFDTGTADRLADDVVSGKSLCSTTSQNAAGVLGPHFERRDDQDDGCKEDLNGKYSGNEVHFSTSYTRDVRRGKDPPQAKYLLPQATSDPLLNTGGVVVLEREGKPALSDPACREHVSLSEKCVSFTSGDLDPVVKGSDQLMTRLAEPLVGDVEKTNFGVPLFESSVCDDSTVMLSADGQSGRAFKEEQGGDVEPGQRLQVTFRQETTSDTSFETSQPLQVQVKSVIVVPLGPLTQQNAEPTNQPPKQISLNCKDKHVSARSCRPVIFDCESELMRDKGMYIYSVTRHMNENRGLNQGIIKDGLET